MDPHGIKVLDGADDHAVVGAVPHDLEFVLLPSGDRPLDEDLANGAGGDTRRRETLKGGVVGGDPGPPAPEDVGRSDHHRQADGHCGLAGLVHGAGDGGRRNGEPDSHHGVLEPFPVLSRGDGLGVCPDEFDAVGLKHP